MRILHWLDKNFEDVICGVLLVGIMTLLMAQVTVRFTIGYGITFSEELSRFMFLYLVYFAASLVACKGAHIRVTAHLKLMPRAVQIVARALSDMLWLGFNAVVLWQGTKLIISMASRPMISGAMLIDMRYVYIALPLAFALICFRMIQRWVRYFRGTVDILNDGQEG